MSRASKAIRARQRELGRKEMKNEIVAAMASWLCSSEYMEDHQAAKTTKQLMAWIIEENQVAFKSFTKRSRQ